MFSVLMSCYVRDDPKFLSEALASILTQTVHPSEVVLVIDGPVQSAHHAVVRRFHQRFFEAEIKFMSLALPENVGLGAALQEGVKHCNEEFIVRMDSDDIARRNRLELLLTLVKQNPDIDVFGGQIEEFVTEPRDLGRRRVVPLAHSDIVVFGRWRNPMNHVTVCFKKSKVLAAGGYEPMLWLEDWFLWLKLIDYGCKFYNDANVHVDVRVRSLTDRRRGMKYLKAELRFCEEAIRRRYWSLTSGSCYAASRCLTRLVPPILMDFVYSKILRVNHTRINIV